MVIRVNDVFVAIVIHVGGPLFSHIARVRSDRGIHHVGPICNNGLVLGASEKTMWSPLPLSMARAAKMFPRIGAPTGAA